jgi:hypothetical protein
LIKFLLKIKHLTRQQYNVLSNKNKLSHLLIIRITISVVLGLTKFLRSRKAVGNYGPSWSSATSQPSKAKQLKTKERGEERKDKRRDSGDREGED